MIRRWLKIGVGVAVSVTSIVGLFALLSTLYNFEITDITGNFSCEGFYSKPCLSRFSVRNPNPYVVDIYSADQVKLEFSPNIKDYALFVPDGRCSATGKCRCDLKDGSKIGFKGWRCVDFTNKTKPRKDKVYNFRFNMYSTQVFQLAGIKYNPTDTIKWTFGVADGELDPIWMGMESKSFLGSVCIRNETLTTSHYVLNYTEKVFNVANQTFVDVEHYKIVNGFIEVCAESAQTLFYNGVNYFTRDIGIYCSTDGTDIICDEGNKEIGLVLDGNGDGIIQSGETAIIITDEFLKLSGHNAKKIKSIFKKEVLI